MPHRVEISSHHLVSTLKLFSANFSTTLFSSHGGLHCLLLVTRLYIIAQLEAHHLILSAVQLLHFICYFRRQLLALALPHFRSFNIRGAQLLSEYVVLIYILFPPCAALIQLAFQLHDWRTALARI